MKVDSRQPPQSINVSKSLERPQYSEEIKREDQDILGPDLVAANDSDGGDRMDNDSNHFSQLGPDDEPDHEAVNI